MTAFETHVLMLLLAVLFFHYIFLFVDDGSKFQKNRLRKSIEEIYKHVVMMNETYHDGIKFHEFRLIYKNREFFIGIHKKELNNRYTTYSIFINGDDAGVFHQVGDCCTRQYYFEAANKRCKYEVAEIIRAAAKEVRKQNKEACKTTVNSSVDNYSYFK